MITKDWKTEVASENTAVLKEYATRSYTWRKSAFTLERSRYGNMYSPEEVDQLLLLGAAPLSISISTAINDSAEALTLQSRPSPAVVPLPYPYDEERFESSRKVAQLYQFLIGKDFNHSFGNLQMDRILKDQSNVGHGFGYVSPEIESGEFQAPFRRSPWRYTFIDPDSTDEFYEDSDAQIIAFPMTKKAAFRYVRTLEAQITLQEFQDLFEKGDNIQNQTMFFEDPKFLMRSVKNDRIMFVNRMTLEDETMYVVFPRKATTDGKIPSYLYKTYKEVPDEVKKMERDGLVEIVPDTNLYLVHYISVGNLGYKKVLPLKTFNMYPLKYDSVDNPFPYSRQYYLYPLNRAINRFFMSALVNMSLLNATRILAEQDSIIDKDNWRQMGSFPGSILEYALPIPNYSKPPQIIKAEPMNEAWLTLPKFIIYISEYISGMFGIMQGNQQGAPDVFSTVAALQSTGSAKIRKRLGDVDAFLSKIGMVQAEMYKNYAPPQGYGSAIDEDGKLITQKFNELEIDPDSYTLKITGDSDLSKGIKSVGFSTRSSAGHESATIGMAMTTLATQMGVPELLPQILKLFNLPNTDDTIKKVEERTNLQGENKQLQETVKQLESKSKIFQNNIFQLVTEVERVKAQGKGEKAIAVLLEKVESMKEQFGQQ